MGWWGGGCKDGGLGCGGIHMDFCCAEDKLFSIRFKVMEGGELISGVRAGP